MNIINQNFLTNILLIRNILPWETEIAKKFSEFFIEIGPSLAIKICTPSTQQTFQCRFNVAFRLIWCRGVAQRQINVETTLCTSTLKFTRFINLETTLRISTLNWTTLGNVETTWSFSTSIFTTLGNFETTLQIWPFGKKIKPRFKSKIIFLSFKEYAGLKVFNFSPF